MLTLVELILELKSLVASNDKNKLERINALFADRQAPAEYQVGRHFVAKHLLGEVTAQIDDLDPRRRKAAIATVRQVFPRTVAANLLRRVVKDPDARVRAAARSTIRELQLQDVAQPDVRYNPSPSTPDTTDDPSSWAFGIFASDWTSTKKPKKAAKTNWIDAYKLPRIANVAALQKLLGIDGDEALAALMRPGTGKGSGYVEFEIPKAKGGTRRIAAPRPHLRKVQRAILDQIVGKVPMHPACHGFVTDRSTVTNAAPHVKAALVVKLDLKDFFPTVHYRRVQGLFEHLGYATEVAAALAGITTYRPKLDDGTVVWPGVLPQGAPTSPALANLACRRLDKRLELLAAKFKATYTRYADDLTFSFKKPPDLAMGRFLWWVDGICQQEGFNERPDKRRILRNKHQQRVTGIVVNAAVHVPRLDKRTFRATLHNCRKSGVASQARDREDFEAYLRGYAAYVHMVEPKLGTRLVAQVEALFSSPASEKEAPRG
ncbi:MAG: reverse transcriptase family protein [Proteobacteria bacterium]|nr:reverse transcriptase family protein [Pseudomonadota bacterium]